MINATICKQTKTTVSQVQRHHKTQSHSRHHHQRTTYRCPTPLLLIQKGVGKDESLYRLLVTCQNLNQESEGRIWTHFMLIRRVTASKSTQHVWNREVVSEHRFVNSDGRSGPRGLASYAIKTCQNLRKLTGRAQRPPNREMHETGITRPCVYVRVTAQLVRHHTARMFDGEATAPRRKCLRVNCIAVCGSASVWIHKCVCVCVCRLWECERGGLSIAGSRWVGLCPG